MQHGGSHVRRRLRAAWHTAVLAGSSGRNAPVYCQGPDSIVCLRLTCPLREEVAGVLAGAVDARLRSAAMPAGTVVLDLSVTTVIGDRARAALESLRRRLEHAGVRLRLVVPEEGVYAALRASGAGRAIGQDAALHTSVRTAILTAYAALPGPAAVTPALRMLLTQPPEPLSLDEVPDRGQARPEADAVSGG